MDEEAFCMTYGEGVGDVNITELVAFYKAPQFIQSRKDNFAFLK